MIDTSRVKYDDDVFCVAPWLNLDIRQDGEVKPCCVSEYTMYFNFFIGILDLMMQF